MIVPSDPLAQTHEWLTTCKPRRLALESMSINFHTDRALAAFTSSALAGFCVERIETKTTVIANRNVVFMDYSAEEARAM
jgi:hypothetical protein